MSEKLQAIRGMEDVLPDASPLVEKLEEACRSVFRQYGYRNIRTPIVEPLALFVRGLGEVTDIVEKEMYVLQDRRADVAVRVAPHQLAHDGLEPLPARRFGRQYVVHAFDGIEFFSHG